MATQVPSAAARRLKKDYKELLREPVPFITAHPLENNILEWHYVLKGPPDSPYADGIYHGLAKFPADFPYKPPSIRMYTPNGRFVPNQSICLSMSEFHPESWSPLWTVGAVLNGLLSFMLTNDRASGCMTTSDQQKRVLARQSWRYNRQNPVFCQLFPDLAEEAKTKP
ncbi:unnamed protein product [Medioppia subpectinata]|uniref:UBC core domain-containing protein n=1 Tax=Medioppia subpectinata TaxID=1979941 RepID=A0A7R9L1A1_9ACAR|nr:unnamed protein product [Medioppia subpectinata]CAG2113647.1 unnamed protein product [Medioppia subpectinata]